MKKVVLLIFIFTLIIVFCHKSIAEKESHVFGIVTRHIALSPSAVQEGCVPFANYINSKLNLSVKVKIVPELSDLIDGLQNGNIDWGFVGSLDYVKLKDKMNITPIVKVYKGGTSKYRAIILVRKDSGINSLDDLKGKTFVYSSVNSAHGYLYPSVLIKSKYNQTFNNFFGNIIKTKKDVDGVYAVYYKKADVVATSETAFSILCELTPKLKRE
ncbi:MAG: phosphate/phosphite/phosphonate ABC transporter substrate-binding protein, partial [Cyanobacteriota bacterium]